MKTITSKKLNALEKKITTLIVEKQAEEARLKSLSKKDATRRMFLVGAYYLNQAEINGDIPKLYNRLDTFLTHKRDRRLFGLSDKVPKKPMLPPQAENESN